jgi:hypothetical protein
VKALTLALVLALGTVSPATAKPRLLTLKVSPAVGNAPLSITVLAIVELAPENRVLEVALISEAFYTSDQRPIDGEAGPRSRLFQFRDLPAGEYRVQARVGRLGLSELSESAVLRVIGFGDP